MPPNLWIVSRNCSLDIFLVLNTSQRRLGIESTIPARNARKFDVEGGGTVGSTLTKYPLVPLSGYLRRGDLAEYHVRLSFSIQSKGVSIIFVIARGHLLDLLVETLGVHAQHKAQGGILIMMFCCASCAVLRV